MTSDDELIESWRKRRDYAAYQTLKNRHKNMVYQFVNRYKAASVPDAALEAEAWQLFDDAVNNYKPSTQAKFSTYLSYNLRKLDRYTKRYQNVARIPEALAAKIGDYDRAHQDLAQRFQRQPTHQELAKKLNMPVRHVQQLHTSRRGDLFEGKAEFEAELRKPETDWLLKELADELNPQERIVYEHLVGINGKKKYANKKLLAQKLGISPGRLSQITRSISTKIGPHLRKRL